MTAATPRPPSDVDGGLSEAEREVLLDPCVCGHTLNDHGDLGGCWLCNEEGPAECWVTCEALMVERVGRIVAARVEQARAADHARLREALRRAGERIRHDHAYPMEVGPHHCEGCDVEAELRAALDATDTTALDRLLDEARAEGAREALRDAADAALTMYDPPVEECINWSEWLRARADVLGGDA